MTRMIRAYAQETGTAVGFKPAGGIKNREAIFGMACPDERRTRLIRGSNRIFFRFGASSMLGDIERQLEFHATGRYSAEYRQPHRVTH